MEFIWAGGRRISLTLQSYVIKSIGLASLARWGFVLGGIIGCLPALVCSTAIFSLAAALSRTFENARQVGVDILGQQVSIDLVQLLQLGGLADSIQKLQVLGIFGILLFAVSLTIATGVIFGLSLVVFGALYNFAGRIKIELVQQ